MIYLFVAYTIIWAVLFFYVLILANQQKRLDRELHSLKEALKEKGGQAS